MTETRYEVRKLPAPAAHPLRTFGVYDTIGKGWVTATLGTNDVAGRGSALRRAA